MYITFEEYIQMYDPMEGMLFERLAFEAGGVMDNHTTGIDNVRKLRRFFPTAEEDAKAVKQCAAKLVNTLYQLHQTEEAATQGRGYIQTDQGLRRQIISRVEAGNEAISYSETKNANTAIDTAAADPAARRKLLNDIVTVYLRGVQDANGVSLLYMANYPRRYLC